MSQQQDPYSQLRQRLGTVAHGRLLKRTARITQTEVDEETDLEATQETFLDPTTQCVVTLEKSTRYVLACGCLSTTSLANIRGACPACARSLRVRMSGRMRLICNQHVMCLRCRAKRRRQLQGGGFWRTLMAIVVWPLFDVNYDDDDTPPPPPPPSPGYPPPGGPHAGPY